MILQTTGKTIKFKHWGLIFGWELNEKGEIEMSLFKSLLDLGRNEVNFALRTTGRRDPYPSRTRHDGEDDKRYNKTPNQANALNKRRGCES